MMLSGTLSMWALGLAPGWESRADLSLIFWGVVLTNVPWVSLTRAHVLGMSKGRL